MWSGSVWHKCSKHAMNSFSRSMFSTSSLLFLSRVFTALVSLHRPSSHKASTGIRVYQDLKLKLTTLTKLLEVALKWGNMHILYKAAL